VDNSALVLLVVLDLVLVDDVDDGRRFSGAGRSVE
jgi:hypothetical protein